MARLDKAQIKTLVALCGLSAATIGVAQNTPGVFYDAVSTDLGVLRGTFALHATAQQLALAASSMIVPWLLAHVCIITLTWACSIVLVTATLAMGAANSVASFCLLGALRGFGAAICANVTITIIANNWFKRRNGAFTGATLAFSGIAGAVCAPLLARSIQAWGWRGGYEAQAALLAACMAPALVLPLSTDPALVGAKPYGVASTNDVKGGCGNDPRLSMHSPWLLVLAAFAFLHSTITGLAQHIAGYAVSVGFDPGFGALLLSLCLLGNCASKLCIGPLADRVGAPIAVLTMVATNAAALALILLGSTTASQQVMMAGGLLYGSVYAVGAVGIALLTRHFFGSEQYAQAFSVVGAAGFVGCAVGLPLVGYTYDLMGSYSLSVIGCLVLHAINCTLLALLLRELSLQRRRLKERVVSTTFA